MTLVFFDLDDTLLAGDSEAAWAKHMLFKGITEDSSFEEKIMKFDQDYRLGKLNFSAYTEFLLSPIKGMSVEEVHEIARPFSVNIVDELKDSISQALLEKHSADECLITSGTLSFIVKEIALLLGFNTFFGTEAEIKGGLYTGRVSGKPNFGEEKVRKIQAWLGNRKFSQTIAYSDSINDLPLLKFASQAVVLNPDIRLREVAILEGWEINDSRNS